MLAEAIVFILDPVVVLRQVQPELDCGRIERGTSLQF
jgi:hypothetical protein